MSSIHADDIEFMVNYLGIPWKTLNPQYLSDLARSDSEGSLFGSERTWPTAEHLLSELCEVNLS